MKSLTLFLALFIGAVVITVSLPEPIPPQNLMATLGLVMVLAVLSALFTRKTRS